MGSLKNRVAAMEVKVPERDIDAGWEVDTGQICAAMFGHPDFKSTPTQYEPNSFRVIIDRNRVSGDELRDAWAWRIAIGEATPDDERIMADIERVCADVPGYVCREYVSVMGRILSEI